MSSEKGKRQRKSKPIFSNLYNTFVGNIVTVIVKTIKGSSKTGIGNLMFTGFLLDECDEYLYVGQTSVEITAAIKKEEVATVVLGDMVNESDIELPEGSEMQ